jgi:hypothetical protein
MKKDGLKLVYLRSGEKITSSNKLNLGIDLSVIRKGRDSKYYDKDLLSSYPIILHTTCFPISEKDIINSNFSLENRSLWIIQDYFKFFNTRCPSRNNPNEL